MRVVPEGIAQNKPPDKAVIPQKRKSSGNSLKRTKSSRLSKPSTLTVFLATFIVQMLATCNKFSGSDHKHSFTTGILDSGNNRHHCFNSAAFFPYGVRWTKINVKGVHGTHQVEVGFGTAHFSTMCANGEMCHWIEENSILNPSCPANLLCIKRFHYLSRTGNKSGHVVDFLENQMRLKSGRTIPFVKDKSDLPLIRLFPTLQDVGSTLQRPLMRSPASIDEDLAVLYKNVQRTPLTLGTALARLGNPYEKHFNILKDKQMLVGLDQCATAHVYGQQKYRNDCWWAGKQTEREVPHSAKHVKPRYPGSHVWSDIGGPFLNKSPEGHQYFVLFHDAYTSFEIVYLMKTKDELLTKWKCYLSDARFVRPSPLLPAENKSILFFPATPEFLIVDSDTMYCKGVVFDFNTQHYTTTWIIEPYKHNGNPIESCMRRIMEGAIALLYMSGFPPSMILYALLAFVKCHNCGFVSSFFEDRHQFQSPQERKTGKKPHIDELPKFGCKAFVHIGTDMRNKGEPHSWTGFYNGPINNSNGYRIYRPVKHTSYNRFHVIFDSRVLYGDVMGASYRKRIESDKEQRRLYNEEVALVMGTSESNPIRSIMCTKYKWEPLPVPPVQHLPPAPLAPAGRDADENMRMEFGEDVPLHHARRTRSQTQDRANQLAAIQQAQQPQPPQRLSNIEACRALEGVFKRGAGNFVQEHAPIVLPVPATPAQDPAFRQVYNGDNTSLGLTDAIITPAVAPQPQQPLATPMERVLQPAAAHIPAPDFGSIDSFQMEVLPKQTLLHEACVQEAVEASHDCIMNLMVLSASALDASTLAVDADYCGLDPDMVAMLALSDEVSRRIANTQPPKRPGDYKKLEGFEKQLVREAQVDEVMNLIRNERVVPVHKSTVKNLHEIDGQWVTKYKKLLSGLLERVRSRYVVRGDLTQPGLHYDPEHTWCPVAAKTTTFVLMVLAVQYGLQMWVLDVAKAFTIGKMDRDEIYMRVPIGFRAQHPDWCPFGHNTTWLLLCSIYGLKQAAAIYYDTVRALIMNAVLPCGTNYGFKGSDNDPCFFSRGELGSPRYSCFSMHIDDKFTAFQCDQDRIEFEGIFKAAGWEYTFEPMKKVLGLSCTYFPWDGKNPVSETNGCLLRDHAQYARDGCQRFRAEIEKDDAGYNAKEVPCKPGLADEINKAGLLPVEQHCPKRESTYRSMLGYLNHTCQFHHVELSFAVSLAGSFMANPSDLHMTLVRNIFQYLLGTLSKDTAHQSKILRKDPALFMPNSVVTVMCDADLGAAWNHRSRTAYFGFLYGNLVGSRSRLQPAVSLSTAEAEFMALAEASRFALWLKRLLIDFGLEVMATAPALVLGDNKSAQKIAKSPMQQKNSRHINRRLFWIKEKILDGTIMVQFVPTDSNISDIGTKALAKVKFIPFRDWLFNGFKRAWQTTPGFVFDAKMTTVANYLTEFLSTWMECKETWLPELSAFLSTWMECEETDLDATIYLTMPLTAVNHHWHRYLDATVPKARHTQYLRRVATAEDAALIAAVSDVVYSSKSRI